MSQTGLTYEPCTLVYTLLDTRVINFQQFYLIIRGNHNFMVEFIKPLPEQNSVHVKLGYQASIANAVKKLGYLAGSVCVSKLNSLISQDEYSELEQLRQHFGISVSAPTASAASEVMPPPPITFKRGRGGRIFNQRPAPYKPKPAKKPTPSYEIPDTQECALTVNNTCEQSEFYISDTQENEEQVGE